jgi:hypothetical protein
MITRRKKNLLWLTLLVVIVVAVGAAFTAANTIDATAGNQLGYAAQNVSGAHVTSMHYTLSADGTKVDSVTFIAAGDLSLGVPQEHGYVGFTVGGTPGNKVDCGTGTTDGPPVTQTTFTCDVTSLSQSIATIQATDIAVAN